jgi:hypothetical protein
MAASLRRRAYPLRNATKECLTHCIDGLGHIFAGPSRRPDSPSRNIRNHGKVKVPPVSPALPHANRPDKIPIGEVPIKGSVLCASALWCKVFAPVCDERNRPLRSPPTVGMCSLIHFLSRRRAEHAIAYASGKLRIISPLQRRTERTGEARTHAVSTQIADAGRTSPMAKRSGLQVLGAFRNARRCPSRGTIGLHSYRFRRPNKRCLCRFEGQ